MLWFLSVWLMRRRLFCLLLSSLGRMDGKKATQTFHRGAGKPLTKHTMQPSNESESRSGARVGRRFQRPVSCLCLNDHNQYAKRGERARPPAFPVGSLTGAVYGRRFSQPGTGAEYRCACLSRAAVPGRVHPATGHRSRRPSALPAPCFAAVLYVYRARPLLMGCSEPTSQ